MPLTKPKRVKVEGVEGEIWIRELSTRERIEIADLFSDLDQQPPRAQMSRLADVCVMACLTETGDPAFTSAEAALDEPFSTLEACVDAVFSLQGLTQPPKA